MPRLARLDARPPHSAWLEGGPEPRDPPAIARHERAGSRCSAPRYYTRHWAQTGRRVRCKMRGKKRRAHSEEKGYQINTLT